MKVIIEAPGAMPTDSEVEDVLRDVATRLRAGQDPTGVWPEAIIAEVAALLDRVADALDGEHAEDWERIPSCDTAECDTCGARKGTCCQHCPYVVSGHPTAAALGETDGGAPR